MHLYVDHEVVVEMNAIRKPVQHLFPVLDYLFDVGYIVNIRRLRCLQEFLQDFLNVSGRIGSITALTEPI